MVDGPTLGKLPQFLTIGHRERMNVLQALKRPLSGYLGGGTPRGGYWTDRLEEEWSHAFGCRYAIPCNSATSGLLAACMAAGIRPSDTVWTTPYSMSATAACAVVLGAEIRFVDIEPIRYGINMNYFYGEPPKALIVTNLFGHPAHLGAMRAWCDANDVVMIEDNAQSIFAKEGKKYAGTIGHMGVFSLNVHKHLQCGEGGVICTNDGELSAKIRWAINHGELSGAEPIPYGLNLRMTEPTAAIACAQLSRGREIVQGRVALAHSISAMMRCAPFVKPPVTDVDCTHSFYVWAGIMPDYYWGKKFVHELNLRGFPINSGYVRPLNYVFRSAHVCPETDRINTRIVTFEVCAYDPKSHHLKRMKEIIEYVSEAMERAREWRSQDAKSA